MAILISAATGNYTASGTWKVCNTGELDSEAGVTTVTTVFATGARIFPGAVTVDAVAVKFAVAIGDLRNAALTVELWQTGVGSGSVAGTRTIVSGTDINPYGGWHQFVFAPKTLSASSGYHVALQASNTSIISVYTNATANNWSRQLRQITATSVPSNGDKLLVLGELSGISPISGKNLVVTMDNTDSGNMVGHIAVCNRGTLEFATGSATGYWLRSSGTAIDGIKRGIDIWGGGQFNIGKSGLPMPSRATGFLSFQDTSAAVVGLAVKSGAGCSMFGQRNSGNGFTAKTTFSGNWLTTSTTGLVNSTLGWDANDFIVAAPTSRSIGNSTKSRVVSIPTPGVFIVLVAPTTAKSGLAPINGEVINLTRNIVFSGINNAQPAFMSIASNAVALIDGVEFQLLGSSTTSKRGVEIETATGTCVIQNSSFHDMHSSGISLNISSTSGNNHTILGCVFNSVGQTAVQIANSTTAAHLIGDCHGITNVAAWGDIFIFNGCRGRFSGLTAIGAQNNGFTFNDTSLIPLGPCEGLVAHTNGNYGISMTNVMGGTGSNFLVYRNNSYGTFLNNSKNCTFINYRMFGNTTSNIRVQDAWYVFIKSGDLTSDIDFSTTYGMQFASAANAIIFVYDSNFSQVSGMRIAHTADINFVAKDSSALVYCSNVLVNPSLPVFGLDSTGPTNSFVTFDKYQGTLGSFKTFKGEGIVSLDSTIFDGTSPSMRMAPNSVSKKLSSLGPDGGHYIPADSGVGRGISVRVRTSIGSDGTDYNGSFPTLSLKANPALGTIDDIVLATATSASTGNWETISGNAPVAPSDGVWEVYVECDGTTGWLNVDNIRCS